MIDPYFESRIENWARASRVGRVTQKSPTLVIMEMLRLQNGEGEDDESSPGEPKSEKGSPRQKPDAADAALLDAAYRSTYLSNLTKQIVRMFYVHGIPARSIETRLCLGFKTFPMHLENAVRQFQKVVELHFDPKTPYNPSDNLTSDSSG